MMCATAWMNHKNIILSERWLSGKTTYSMFHLHEMFRIGKSIKIESRLLAV